MDQVTFPFRVYYVVRIGLGLFDVSLKRYNNFKKICIQAESMDKRKISLDVSEWERVSRTDIPQQQNGSDCGVFACKFADFAARRMDIPFDQSHMPYYRKRMVYQLCQNDLAAF